MQWLGKLQCLKTMLIEHVGPVAGPAEMNSAAIPLRLAYPWTYRYRAFTLAREVCWVVGRRSRRRWRSLFCSCFSWLVWGPPNLAQLHPAGPTGFMRASEQHTTASKVGDLNSVLTSFYSLLIGRIHDKSSLPQCQLLLYWVLDAELMFPKNGFALDACCVSLFSQKSMR